MSERAAVPSVASVFDVSDGDGACQQKFYYILIFACVREDFEETKAVKKMVSLVSFYV